MDNKFVRELIDFGFKKYNRPDGSYWYKEHNGRHLLVVINHEIAIAVADVADGDFAIPSKVIRENESLQQMIDMVLSSEYMFS